MYLLQVPGSNPQTDVPVSWRQYIKFQLTGTELECWKYATLCEWVGKAKAGQFLGDYISLSRRKPTASEYEYYTGELVEYYDSIGQASAGNAADILDNTEAALRVGSIQHFFEWTPLWSDERQEETVPDPEEDGTVTLTLGRARYLLGGHNWARGNAVPADGEDVQACARFENQNGAGTLLNWDEDDRVRPNKVTVTGPHSDGFFVPSGMGRPYYLTIGIPSVGPSALATAHDAQATGTACWRAGLAFQA